MFIFVHFLMPIRHILVFFVVFLVSLLSPYKSNFGFMTLTLQKNTSSYFSTNIQLGENSLSLENIILHIKIYTDTFTRLH